MTRIEYYERKSSYQLAKPAEIAAPELRGYYATHRWFQIDAVGTLYAHEGYSWDGDTYGIDSPKSRIASIGHDIALQAWNEGVVGCVDGFDFADFRKRADDVYYRLCSEAGMWFPRARVRFAAIGLFGRFARPSGKPEVIVCEL